MPHTTRKHDRNAKNISIDRHENMVATIREQLRENCLRFYITAAEEISKRLSDGILIENMHDVPYIKQKDISPEITTMMTRVCAEIRKVTPPNIACGVQILAGCNKEAIAVAKATGLQFIRAEGFIFSHVADEGLIDASAGTLLRYRKQIDADNVLIFADVKKKHSSHAITFDINLLEMVKTAEFFLADGVILTGNATGDETNVRDLLEVRKCVATRLPVLIGSGVTLDNVDNYTDTADALIIGSYFKTDGRWENELDPTRVRAFIKHLKNQ